jgi:hypothetical protein
VDLDVASLHSPKTATVAHWITATQEAFKQRLRDTTDRQISRESAPNSQNPSATWAMHIKRDIGAVWPTCEWLHGLRQVSWINFP